MYQGLLRCRRASVSWMHCGRRRLAAEAERRVPVREQEEDAEGDGDHGQDDGDCPDEAAGDVEEHWSAAEERLRGA